MSLVAILASGCDIARCRTREKLVRDDDIPLCDTAPLVVSGKLRSWLPSSMASGMGIEKNASSCGGDGRESLSMGQS
jgi:hypothetical protein